MVVLVPVMCDFITFETMGLRCIGIMNLLKFFAGAAEHLDWVWWLMKAYKFNLSMDWLKISRNTPY
jgi:hypothetical protein